MYRWDERRFEKDVDLLVETAIAFVNEGKEKIEDTVFRYRTGGGGIYVAYVKEWRHPVGKDYPLWRSASVEIGACDDKRLSWWFPLHSFEYALDDDVLFLWNPKPNCPFAPYDKEKVYKPVKDAVYLRECLLYDWMFEFMKRKGWNEEDDLGYPRHKTNGLRRRSKWTDCLIEVDKDRDREARRNARKLQERN